MSLDHGTNLADHPKWQALFRGHQTPTSLMWGENGRIFRADGTHPYKREMENLDFYFLNTGHFALEEYGDEIA